MAVQKLRGGRGVDPSQVAITSLDGLALLSDRPAGELRPGGMIRGGGCLVAQCQAPAEERLRSILGDSIWGADDDTLEGSIGALLVKRGLTLGTMESCTGGLLASILTDAAGSSTYFKGGLVAYSNEVKTVFGVDADLIASYGVISLEVAAAMAESARQRLEADIGIGITGVAGPDEMEGKPAGTVHIAVDCKGEKKEAFSINLPPRRIEVKHRAALLALAGLRRLLLSLD